MFGRLDGDDVDADGGDVDDDDVVDDSGTHTQHQYTYHSFHRHPPKASRSHTENAVQLSSVGDWLPVRFVVVQHVSGQGFGSRQGGLEQVQGGVMQNHGIGAPLGRSPPDGLT